MFDAQFQPAAGLTVFLVDAEKVFQSAYGFAYTDATGYFLINYPGQQTESQAGAQAASAPQLFLEVADAKSQPVYISTTPLQPTPGSITYQNVFLPAGDEPIGNPPPPVRGVAMPGEKR